MIRRYALDVLVVGYSIIFIWFTYQLALLQMN